MPNKLYYGDNYDVLQRYVQDESVDLIYLDPPFNSRQDYNVLFAEKDGSQSNSQIHAFEDTWEWNIDAERSYEHVVEQGGRVAEAMRAFRIFLGGSDMMAYFAMMAPRLAELRRVLKQSGSILSPLRRDSEPLPQDSDGRRLRAAVLSQRGDLEAVARAQRC
jgi:DNA modification methylase